MSHTLLSEPYKVELQQPS